MSLNAAAGGLINIFPYVCCVFFLYFYKDTIIVKSIVMILAKNKE